MKRLSKLLLALSVTAGLSALSGCSPAYTSMLYKSGSKSRGIALMLPVVQTTPSVLASSPVQWDLKEEFNIEIARRLSVSKKVYLLNQNVSLVAAEAFNSPTGQVDPALAAQIFPAEFVIATEILEQSIPKSDAEPIRISTRVRLFDVRKHNIKLVYQEIIETKQSQTGFTGETSRLHWSNKNFESTPLGLAHNRLVKEVVARVEGYICANY